ncbi:MAG: NAD(P)/FAD-dependent oxidoreductase [Desulfocucumaceae bacterium]
MKVAIIGAGLAGLACAHEFESHGISPVIFEQRHRPGELFDHCAAVLELFARPYEPQSNLRDRYGLDLRPLNTIKAITMKSPGKKSTVTGKLGYFFLRGQDPASLESQLYQKVRSKIITNTRADYSRLSRQFDYVVVANGNFDMARTAGIWSLVYPSNLIGGTVIGNFDQTKMFMWVDTRYSKTAYAYLAPMEKKRAFLALVVPESTAEEARWHWKLFWELEKHPYDLINEIIVVHNAGFVYPHQVGNVLFAGIAGGFLDPFLGFGALSSMKSGVLAARAITGGKRYEDLIVQLKEDMQHSLVCRDLFSKISNRDYDRLVATVGVPGIKHLVYNTNTDVLRIVSAAAGHLNKMTQWFKKV